MVAGTAMSGSGTRVRVVGMGPVVRVGFGGRMAVRVR